MDALFNFSYTTFDNISVTYTAQGNALGSTEKNKLALKGRDIGGENHGLTLIDTDGGEEPQITQMNADGSPERA